MEQEEPESKRQRTVASLLVCSLLTPVDEIPVSYVATHETDDRPVYDHKTGERLFPHLVKVGRQIEHVAMIRHQLFERVPIAIPRSKKVRCQWLDEMKDKWTIRVQQTRSDGSGPWCTIWHIRWHCTPQMHQDHHLECCINQEDERRTVTCACTFRRQRCVLACAAAKGRADCDVSAAW